MKGESSLLNLREAVFLKMNNNLSLMKIGSSNTWNKQQTVRSIWVIYMP